MGSFAKNTLLVKPKSNHFKLPAGHFSSMPKFALSSHETLLSYTKKKQSKKKLAYERICQATVKPLLSGHPRDLSKCPLNRGCALNRGLL